MKRPERHIEPHRLSKASGYNLRAALIITTLTLAATYLYARTTSPRIHIAAHQQNLWVAKPGKKSDQFDLFFRDAKFPKEKLYNAYSGKAQIKSLASFRDRLYIVFPNNTLQAIHAKSLNHRQTRSFSTSQLPPLPSESKLLHFTAGSLGPVALLLNKTETKPEKTKTKISPKPTKPDTKLKNDDKDAPTNTPDPKSTQPEKSEKATESSKKTTPHPLTLTYLEADRWSDIPLPKTVTPKNLLTLVLPKPNALPERELLAITVLTREPDPAKLGIHEYDGAKWKYRTLDMPWPSSTQAVGRQGVIYGVKHDVDQNKLTLHALEAKKAYTIGEIKDLPKQTRWTATSTTESKESNANPDRLTVIVTDADSNILWAHIKIDDTTTKKQTLTLTALTEIEKPQHTPNPLMLIVVAAMLIGILVLFTATKRDPKKTQITLPKDYLPALGRRGVAAIIDLLPAVLISMFIFKVASPADLVRNWPESVNDWREMLPALSAIGIYAFYGAVMEAFTATTIGKMMTGCKVVNYQGANPHIWQILARNFFKVIELILPFLIVIVPLITPHHQRLGDLIAQTLVVAPVPTLPEE